MPKRIGFLWEKMISRENCIRAEREMCKNKKDNAKARFISKHVDEFGGALFQKLIRGTFEFHKPYERSICESYKKKERHLKIPCLEDQAAMQAWLNIATPYIVKRNYFYNCGSIPGGGQTRAVKGLQKHLSGKKPPKWACVSDIRHFYETCPHEAVLAGLRRIFKDEKFIGFAAEIMKSMSDTGIGLAIGYPVSHWFANVALMHIDHELRRRFPDVLHFRYMDDTVFISHNKRHLRRAFQFYAGSVEALGMSIKPNWQLFPIRSRGITFLSYRFFHGYTILTKPLMFRIARKMKNAAKGLTVHLAASVMSYMGILKHCNSRHFFEARVLPYIRPKKCRRMISDASKLCDAA